MDRFLFDSFAFELEDETMENVMLLFVNQAKTKIERKDKDKITFNYYPKGNDYLQFVVEGKRNENGIGIYNMKVHHASGDVWKLKIINKLSDSDEFYMASREDGSGFIIIRFVNEQVLDEITSGTIISAQVVGFAINIDIFENEKAYSDSVPEGKDGQKYLMGEGALIPTNMIVNNSANLSDEERKNKDHSFDNLVDFKGTIISVNKYSLNMFDMDLNNYYTAEVETEFGRMQIVIPTPMIPEGLKGFGSGNIIAGKLILSGDVCIDDYEKYTKECKTKLEDGGN